MHRRTPCVGICSTTYGDLVCRGCKRYAHEIVSWNRYSPEQRDQVEGRLRAARLEVLSTFIRLEDPQRAARALALDGVPELVDVYDRWRRSPELAPGDVGLRVTDSAQSRAALEQRIDAEWYRRAKAHYERSFKISTA